jgi:transposase-like protein
MLTVETIARIRREYFLKGKTIREIARDLRVSRNTVPRWCTTPPSSTAISTSARSRVSSVMSRRHRTATIRLYFSRAVQKHTPLHAPVKAHPAVAPVDLQKLARQPLEPDDRLRRRRSPGPHRRHLSVGMQFSPRQRKRNLPTLLKIGFLLGALAL